MTGVGTVTALASHHLLSGRNGSVALYKKTLASANSVCWCPSVMGAGVMNRYFGIIDGDLAPFVPVGSRVLRHLGYLISMWFTWFIF